MRTLVLLQAIDFKMWKTVTVSEALNAFLLTRLIKCDSPFSPKNSPVTTLLHITG